MVPGLSQVVQVVAGEYFTAALRRDGSVVTFGSNFFKALGRTTIGTTDPTPGEIPGLPPIQSLSAGRHNLTAIDTNGFVWTWGGNDLLALGRGIVGIPQTSPARVPGVADIVEVSSGHYHTLARTRSGRVYSWGGAGWGETGRLGEALPPAEITSLGPAADIAAGNRHSVVLLADGRVVTFGEGAYGELGINPTAQIPHPSPTALTGLIEPVIAVVAGGESTALLTSARHVYTFGNNDLGQLGRETPAPSPNPQPRLANLP